MYAKFENLDEEKRERILKAAMKEFSHKGYDQASTNEMVKEADIAKGLLFHYFKSKKQLFFYIYDHCIERITSELYASSSMEEQDFFVKIRLAQQAKLELLNKYPDMFKFVQVAYMDESPAIRLEMEQKNQKLINLSANKMFESIDRTKFKDGLDIQMVINIVFWSLEGYSNSYMLTVKQTRAANDFSKAFEDVNEYIKLFKECFYK